MKKKIFILSLLFTIFSAIPAFAASKDIEAVLDKDYTNAKFDLAFEKPGEYTITITDSGEKHSYEATQTSATKASCIVQDARKGKWKIHVETPDNTYENEEGETTTETVEVGVVHVSIEGSFQEAVDVSEDIKVAQDIAGLKMYFRDSTFVAEWTDSNHGNINIEITDAKSQQKLVSDTVKGGYCEYDIDTKAHERIVVTLVPSESSNIEGAAQSKTMETLNDPDATITFENVTITNKDSIKMYAKFGKPYSIESYLNEKMVDKHTELEAGDHEFDLPTEVGGNHYLVYVIDPETGYMKSTTYDLVKDVVAPVIKMERSYENLTTEDESILFEGYIDPDHETFTINDAPIKVEGDHTFKYEYPLKEGTNNIHIEAVDAAGNVSEQNIVITRVIPQVAKVPWFPIILGVCLFGIVATYIIMMIVRRRRGYEEDSGHKRRGEKSEDEIPRDVIPVWAQDILRLAIPLVAVVIILRFVVCITSVMSGSMEPKLGVGNTVAYSRLAYAKHEPQRGDIILLWSDELNEYLAKRVIGIPGDEITFADGYVLINGELADETEYIAEDIETNCPKVFNVPEYTVFVLGDNREYSYDSRYWNNPYIKYSDIIGKYMGQTSFNVKYMIQQKIAEKKGESTKPAEDKMLDDSGAAVAPTEEEMSDAVEHSEEYEELTEASEVTEE